MRGCTVADMTGANFHFMIEGRITLCGKNVPAAWRLSDYTLNCQECARAKGMANHPSARFKKRCFCGRPINAPGAILCAEHD